MEDKEDIPIYQSSEGTSHERNYGKADLCATSMPIHRESPENLPSGSGDASHHASGMSGLGLTRNDGKIKRQRRLASRGELTEQAQQLIDKINEKRKSDTTVLDNFRKVLHDKVTLTCNTLEERMYKVYETSGKNMQPKLQEFFATLDRIETMEQELQHFKEALGVLYSDISNK